MSIPKLSDLVPAAVKFAPLLALTACGVPEEDLNEVRTEIKGMSLASAMDRMESRFVGSCESLGEVDSGRLNMDALAVVRDEIGGDLLLKDKSEWICHYYQSSDCDFKGSDCNSLQDQRPSVYTTWNLTAGTEDLLNNLYVGDSPEVRTQVKEAYDTAAALNNTLAAEFRTECNSEKHAWEKPLSSITARRTAMLEEQGFEPQKWYCTEPYSDEFEVEMDTKLVAKRGQHGRR